MSTVKEFEIKAYYSVESVYYYSYARHALVSALNYLKIGKGDKIAIPVFVCHDLLSSLASVGVEPIYYPLNYLLEPDLSADELSEAKAIILVNYFGFPQDISSFKSVAENTGAVLIEDNAHGFLSSDRDGHLLGTRADIGLLSMRKTFYFLDGAALLLNKKFTRSDQIRRLACNSKSLPFIYFLKKYLNFIQSKTGIKLRSSMESLTRHIRKLRTGHSLPQSSAQAEIELPGAAEIHCSTLEMLGKIQPTLETKRRRMLYNKFDKKLKNLGITPLFTELADGVVPFGYPFRADNITAEKVAKIAHKEGYSCAHWPDLPISLLDSIPDYHKNVWWVNFLC